MEKRYQVFVSSTYEDLLEERAAAILSLLKLNCIPAGMELFPSSDNSVWEVVQRTIRESDYYILIIAGRYGSISNDGKTSWTEREYDYAQEIKKPIYIFLYQNIGEIKYKDIDNKNKIMAFRDKVSKRVLKTCKNLENLQTEISIAIAYAKENAPGIGWIRANSISQGTEQGKKTDDNHNLENIRSRYKRSIEINYTVHFWEKIYVLFDTNNNHPPYDKSNSLITTKELLFDQLASFICSHPINLSNCSKFLNDYLYNTQEKFVKQNQLQAYNQADFISDNKKLADIINGFKLDNLTEIQQREKNSQIVLTTLGTKYYRILSEENDA